MAQADPRPCAQPFPPKKEAIGQTPGTKKRGPGLRPCKMSCRPSASPAKRRPTAVPFPPGGPGLHARRLQDGGQRLRLGFRGLRGFRGSLGFRVYGA